MLNDAVSYLEYDGTGEAAKHEDKVQTPTTITLKSGCGVDNCDTLREGGRDWIWRLDLEIGLKSEMY